MKQGSKSRDQPQAGSPLKGILPALKKKVRFTFRTHKSYNPESEVLQPGQAILFSHFLIDGFCRVADSRLF